MNQSTLHMRGRPVQPQNLDGSPRVPTIGGRFFTIGDMRAAFSMECPEIFTQLFGNAPIPRMPPLPNFRLIRTTINEATPTQEKEE